MIVLYLKANNQYIMKIDGFPELAEQGNKLYMGDEVVINDLTKAGYREYPDQPVVIPTEWDEELETDEPIPQTLEQLGLRDFILEDLPTSQHPAVIKSIDKKSPTPIIVTREYCGQTFDVSCLITEGIKSYLDDGSIDIGDLVIISYFNDSVDEAIVMHKVYEPK